MNKLELELLLSNLQLCNFALSIKTKTANAHCFFFEWEQTLIIVFSESTQFLFDVCQAIQAQKFEMNGNRNELSPTKPRAKRGKRSHPDDSTPSSPSQKVPRVELTEFSDVKLSDKLSADQQQAIDAVRKGHNVFISGCAGTGKSFLIAHLMRVHAASLVSTTGASALSIGGKTLHSWAGIGLGNGAVAELCEKVQKNYRAKMRWLYCRALVIDEVSMLPAELFDKLDQIGRKIRRTDAPFGGIQIILVGDFFQLPPVSGDVDVPFTFKAQCWPQLQLDIVILQQQFRQADSTFIELLSRARVGQLLPADIDLLNTRVKANLSRTVNGATVEPTRLYCRKNNVESVNLLHLQRCEGTTHVYQMASSGLPAAVEKLRKNCPAPATLHLRLGAQVMFLVNSAEDGLVNGSRGVVVEFLESGTPVVQFVDCRVPVATHTWEQDETTVTQLPLILAWALTIHKSQGATLDSVLANFAEAFTPGQAYVALSRVKDLSNLSLEAFAPQSVYAHPEVIEFYK